MKIPNARKGLSQSTDLLLILTATLAVGGIMYGVATGLITGMGNVTSLQVSNVNLSVGTNSNTFTVSLKNGGNTIIKAASGNTASITISGLSLGATETLTATGGDTHGDSLAWGCTGGSTSTSQTTCTSTVGITLNPGDIISLSFYTSTNSGFTTGSTYAVNGVMGSETFATSVVATSA